jgi:zinc transporter
VQNPDGPQVAVFPMQAELSARVVAAVFLPLGLITGLLGVNVGGIPGANNTWAFYLVMLVLVGLGGGMAWWLRSACPSRRRRCWP